MMTHFCTRMRRLLERARLLGNRRGHNVRRQALPVAAVALALAAALPLSLLGVAAPAGAAEESSGPRARLTVVVKEIKIHDDREGILSGEGEMNLELNIWRCDEGFRPPCGGSSAEQIVRAGALFGAGTGETVTLDREVPRAGDVMSGDTSPELGFAVQAGRHYVVEFSMTEFDGDSAPNYDEYMGKVLHFLDTDEHGLGVGTHSARSSGVDGRAGDYTVTYEIRRAALPDLRPVNIEVQDLPNSARKRICMAVQNIDVGQAGAFEAALRVDGEVPPGGRATAAAPSPGNHVNVCVETELPTAGQHKLAAVVDEPRAVTEFDETNNVYEEQYTATGPTQADLVVTAIRVNGQAPDGKDDCKEGKNEVVAVVKNAGAADAGPFVVRVTVDGDDDQSTDVRVDGLEAGKEREVRIADLKLKAGGHSLSVVADAKGAIADSNQANNLQTVGANCGA